MDAPSLADLPLTAESPAQQPQAAVPSREPQLVIQTGHANSVNSVAFSPDGKLIASGGGERTIKLWDAATGKQLRSLEGHAKWINSVAFSPDGKVIAKPPGHEEPGRM